MRAVLTVSPTAFVAIWWAIQLFHVVCIIHAYAVIQIHHYCIVNDMTTTFDYLGASTFSYFKSVMAAYAVLIVLHALAFTATLWWSIRNREWCFTSKARTATHHRSPLRQPGYDGIRRTGRVSVAPQNPAMTTVDDQTKIAFVLNNALQVAKRFGSAASKQLDKISLNGQYYEVRFLVSELVEIVLQVFQAYKLSELVSRVWINRLYAIVLVLNCWSTPIVYICLRRDRISQRILLRVMDVIFDAIASMVIPFVVFYPYYLEFDTVRQDFPLEYYYHDVWFIQAISENRQIFVTSWIDYISKISPGLSIFASTLVLKKYIIMDKSESSGASEAKPVASARTSGTRRLWFQSLAAFMPMAKTRVVEGMSSRDLTIRDLIRAGSGEPNRTRKTSLAERQRIVIVSFYNKYKRSWYDAVFVLCGLGILVIHVHATIIGEFSSVTGCLLEVRPWFQTTYSCVALEVNCGHGQYDNGSNSDAIEDAMGDAKIDAIRSLVMSSCTNLRVPPVLQGMKSLQMLKVYNSTVERWDTEAELREDQHHDLQMLYVCDTNFTDRTLPRGILGDNFPKRLVDIEFSGTNLKTLPSDLHEKWTFIQYFVLENSPGITEIPEPLVKLKIPQLMLGTNSIERVPDDLLVDQAFWVLRLDGNPLPALPEQIGSIEWLYRLGVSYTQVSSLPPWMHSTQYDPVGGAAVQPVWSPIEVLASGSPLCHDDSEALRATAKGYFEWDCSTDTLSFAYPVEQERAWRAASHAEEITTRG